MSPDQEAKARDIFQRAMALDVDDGSQLIDELCGEDDALKGAVLRIMDAEAASSFEALGGVPSSDVVEAAPMVPANDGEMIGAFRIIRTIGSGGMGIVYEAEQEYPERRVALKVLPPSDGRPAAKQRFHTEVQLLARIDHPGVARMLEAGVHQGAGGQEQPYFAMEFVRDACDLTRWGQSKGLTQRLQVFAEVCDAVQHGHQQGVVHRDLKPANVLVGRGDTPKVIDFGVAGAIEGADAGLRTRATQAGDIVGTLQYMAPEQLQGTLHVDTRTDVYALGLLLYELIAGEPPFSLAGRSISEILTIIRDESLERELPALQQIPEDLWWVLLRATEKEPARRYASASELAADLRRFMDGRPVEAARPSRTYAFKKLVERNRSATVAVALVLLSIVAGTTISVQAMFRAEREAESFRSMNGVLTGMFQDVRADAGGANIPAVELLDRAAERVATFSDRPDLEAALRLTLAKSYLSLGYHDAAIREGTRGLELRDELAPDKEAEMARYLASAQYSANHDAEAQAIVDHYGEAWFTDHAPNSSAHRLSIGRVGESLAHRRGHGDEASVNLKRMIREAEVLVGEAGPASVGVHAVLGELETALVLTLLSGGAYEEAERRVRRRIEREELERADRQADGVAVSAARLLVPKATLAKCLILQRRFQEGAEVLEAILPETVAAYGEEHSHTLSMMTDLASAYTSAGEAARALPILEEVVRAREARSGLEHPATLVAKKSLANARVATGDGSGEELLREGLAMRTKVFGPDDARTLKSLSSLCQFLRKARRLEEAEPLHAELYERSQRVLKEGSLEFHRAGAAIGLLRLLQGRAEEAAALMEPAWRGFQRRAGNDDSETLILGNNFAGGLAEQGRWGEAADVFVEILAGMRSSLRPDDRRIVGVILNIAALRARHGEMGLSLEGFNLAMDWALEHLPEMDSLRLRIQEATGSHLVAMGRATEALPLYREVLRASQLNPGLDALQRSEFRLGQARCQVAAGEHEKGAQSLQTVLEMERARVGDADPKWLAELEAELEEAKRLASEGAAVGVD